MTQATLSLAFGSIVENFRAATQCDPDVWSGQNLSAYGASTATTFTLYGSGGVNYETFEIGSNRADADATRHASLVAFANINTATYKALGAIDFYTDGGTANKRGGRIVLRTRPDNSTAMTDALIIDRSQNVGVGTAPIAPYRLTVLGADGSGIGFSNGTAQATLNAVGGAGFAGTITNHPFSLWANNAERIRVSVTGDLTVGAAAATNKLSVRGAFVDVSTTGATNWLSFYDGSSGDNPAILFPSGQALRIGPGGISGATFTEVIRVDGTGLIPGSDNTQNFGSASKRAKSVFTGRIVTGAATPTATVTGAGTTGAVAIDTGSSDMAVILTITPGGTGIAASGTVVLTFSTGNGAYGTNAPAVLSEPCHGTGTWNALASAIPSTPTTTSVTINWANNGVALTSASTYKIIVHSIGK